MAEQNGSNTTSPAQGGGDTVTFDPAPKLEAAAGGPSADVQFEAADDLGAGGQQGTAGKIREEAGKLTQQAADRARDYAGQGKERVTSGLDEVARMMSSAADQVDEKLGADYGRYARSAADGISGFAESLRGREVDDLMDDVTAFVKKSPVIAVGVAAGIGFVLARLIKSGIDAASDLTEGGSDTSSTSAAGGGSGAGSGSAQGSGTASGGNG